MPPPSTTPRPPPLALRIALVSLVFAALSPLLGSVAAVIRYVTGVGPLSAWGVALAGGVAMAAAVALRARWGRPRWHDAVVMTSLALGAAWLVRRAMALPGFDDLPTIGGGDAGNHLAIAAAWATDLPRVYLGFSGEHALLWAVDRGLRGDLVHSLSDVHRLGLWTGLTTLSWAGWLLVRPAVVAGRWRALVAALAVAGGLASVVWADVAGLLAHYLQVEGFFPHAFALAPIGLVTWVVVLDLPTPTRLAALALGVVSLRFTYGLQLGDALLGVAAVCAYEGASRGLRVARDARSGRGARRDGPQGAATQRWLPWLNAAAAVVCALGAAVALWTLWGRRHKTGGVQPFDPTDLLVALALLSLAPLALAALRSGRGDEAPHATGDARSPADSGSASYRRLAAFTLGFCGPAAALTAVAQGWATRGYYVVKYPLTPLMWAALLAPMAAAALTLAALRSGAPGRSGARRAVVVLALLAALVGGPVARDAMTHARPYVAATWHERTDPARPMRALRPLFDRHVLAFIAREVTARGLPLGAFVHDKWPVYNATLSLANGWTSPAFDRVPELQARRFPAFQQGAALTPGTCVVWSETPVRLQEVRRRAQRQGTPLARRLDRWRKDPRRRCERYTPHWVATVRGRLAGHHKDDGHGHSHVSPHLPLSEAVCALCEPARPAGAAPGRQDGVRADP